MKKPYQKILIICILVAFTLLTEFIKTRVFAADLFLNQVTGKILIEVDNHGKGWYVFPADKRRYYLGKPHDAFILAKSLALEEATSSLSKLKINTGFLNQNTNDKDQDGLSEALEQWFKADPDKKDSDGDGYNDDVEIINNYPSDVAAAEKIALDNDLAKKLAGNFIFNKNLTGLWYVNPANLQAYFIENEANMLKLMQKVALGLDGASLLKIEGLIVGAQYMNEEIKKNETVKEIQTGQLRYTDDSKLYSFAFPPDWTIKKYPDAPDLVHITNAARNFIGEKKAAIMIQIINMGASSTLDSFKIVAPEGMVISQEATSTIQNKPLYGKLAEFPHMRQRSTIVDLGAGRFLQLTLNTPKSLSDAYDKTFNDLVKSLKFY